MLASSRPDGLSRLRPRGRSAVAGELGSSGGGGLKEIVMAILKKLFALWEITSLVVFLLVVLVGVVGMVVLAFWPQ